MISKSLIKYVQSLHLRKNRQKYDKFIAQGPKIAIEIINSDSLELEYIFANREFIVSNTKALDSYREILFEVNEKELERISTTKTPNSVTIVANKRLNNTKVNLKNQWILFLDRIQDPGNVGTIIRTADWFGINHIILSPECADLYNPKVLQSTMGAFLRINVLNLSFEEMMNMDSSLKIYAAALNGANVFKQNLEPGVIVIGNESKGIQNKILDASDILLTIPAKGKAESLNAGVACGIIVSSLLQ